MIFEFSLGRYNRIKEAMQTKTRRFRLTLLRSLYLLFQCILLRKCRLAHQRRSRERESRPSGGSFSLSLFFYFNLLSNFTFYNVLCTESTADRGGDPEEEGGGGEEGEEGGDRPYARVCLPGYMSGKQYS